MGGGPDVAGIRQSLLAAGVDPASFPAPEPVTCWPDNEPALAVFMAMNTQWASGPGGATGLRYEALPEVWQRVGIRGRRARDEAFVGLQVMEAEALAWLREKRGD